MTRLTLTLSISSLLVCLALAGCAGDAGYTPGGTVCTPKANQACSCADGRSGMQICGPAGTGWGACLCTDSNPNPNPNPNPSWPDGGVASPDSGSGIPGGTGTMTCDQIDACMMNCTSGDTTCQTNCFTQGTATAQAQMTAVESCMSSAAQSSCQSQCASETQQCYDCLNQACQAQLDACLGPNSNPTTPGGTGSSTCAQIDACMMACAETDNACYDTCFYQGTANAQALMTAFEDCLSGAETGSCQAQCANWDQTCWDCVDQACQTQLNTCLSN